MSRRKNCGTDSKSDTIIAKVITLSWDLFIIVIFAVIGAYSLIIGRDSTLKVIIGTYIAILASDGLGNLFEEYILSSRGVIQFLRILAIQNDDQAIALFKVLIFIIAVVIIAIKGGFFVNLSQRAGIPGLIINLIFGLLSAGLVISTLLVYISGSSFFSGELAISNSTIQSIYSNSRLTRIMIDNNNLWFSLPAILFVVLSLFHKPEANPNQ